MFMMFIFCVLSTFGLIVANDENLRPIKKSLTTLREMTTLCDEGSEPYGSDCWCSKGYYSDNGLSPCNQCDFGSYSSEIGGRLESCKCQSGFYSSTGYAPCEPCPEGTESKVLIGATSCTCKPGYTGSGEPVPSQILSSTANFLDKSYFELSKFYASHSFSAPCSACPINSGTWDIFSSESQGNKCLCDPDTKSPTGFGPCEPCGEGSGSVTLEGRFRAEAPAISFDSVTGKFIYGEEFLLSYDRGFYVPSLTYYPSIQMTKCYCKAGYYSPDGSGTDAGGDCIRCPFGKTSTNYNLPFYNDASVEPLNTKCACLRNFYKNSSVIRPSSGYIESTDDCIPCDQGSVTSQLDGTICLFCDIGYYSPSGMVPCAKCPDGMTTDGYQQSSCTVVSTYTPTKSPTPSPTPSSPSITNPPLALPTRAPVQSKKPTAYPTLRPSLAGACLRGFFSTTGFSPDCQACPTGTTNFESGSTDCAFCAAGYYGAEGKFPCTACPDMYTSNDKRTGCYLCIGYEPGCSMNISNAEIAQQSSIDALSGQVTQMFETVDKMKGKTNRNSKDIDTIRSDVIELKKAIKKKNPKV